MTERGWADVIRHYLLRLLRATTLQSAKIWRRSDITTYNIQAPSLALHFPRLQSVVSFATIAT